MAKATKIEKPAVKKLRFYHKASGAFIDAETKLEWLLGPNHPFVGGRINAVFEIPTRLAKKYQLPTEDQVKELNKLVSDFFMNDNRYNDFWLGRKILLKGGKKHIILGDPEAVAKPRQPQERDIYVIGVKVALKNGDAFTVAPCGSITDNDTGYVWFRPPKNSAGDTDMNWLTAKNFAEDNDPCSSQWTLPSAAALEGLNDNIIAAQAISPGITPFDDWTGTTMKKTWSAYKVLNYAKAISLGDEGGTINYPVTSSSNFRVIGIRIG